MRFIMTIILVVIGRLVALAIAKPIPNWGAGGILAIPLTRHSPSLNSNPSIRVDLDAISFHGISVREKILSGLDNYEMNMGTMHPLAVKRDESGLGTRGASIALARSTYGRNIWMGEISIGTPSKTFQVHIDTASADMWVLETGCGGSLSGDQNFWNPKGTIVKGDLYTDNVTMAGFTANPQTFGAATYFISRLQNNANANGLLGLAFSSISEFRAAPLFESLFRQNRQINPIFSLKLSSSGAEMFVGGINGMLYNGDIAYAPVTYPAFWQVSMDDVRVDGNIILKNIPVIFDTGSSYVYGDWNRVLELYRRLGGTLKERKGFGYYYLPCDSFPTVSFTLGGRTFEISPEALRLDPIEEGSANCFSAIVADGSSIAYWTIGMTFLQGVYSVFDYTALRVGFADLA